MLLLLRIAALLAAACGIANTAWAMDVTIVQSGLPVYARLEGEVRPGDASRIIRELNNARPAQILAELKDAPTLYDARQWLWLDVESTGGDLDETLQIGRFLRAENAMITTKKTCSSACVFLLAGAVERVGLDAAQGQIGIHRPYPADARGATMVEFERIFERTRKKVADYLGEIDVPPSLADLMYSIPPEEMYMLSSRDIRLYFPPLNAVWDDSTIARRAALFRISSLNYRQQVASAKQACRPAGEAPRIVSAKLGDPLPGPDCPARMVLAKPPIEMHASEALIFSGHCGISVASNTAVGPGNKDFNPCLPAFAGGSADGAAQSAVLSVCQNCHGPRGDSVSSSIPRLNGQQADYLAAQLKSFRDRTRADPHAQAFMWGVAAQLNDPMIAALAKYFSGQAPAPPQAGSVSMKEGERIYANGLPKNDGLACNTCHGDHGEGNSTIPRLAGQHAGYLKRRLESFRSGSRSDPIMHIVTKDITDGEIDSLVAYLANN